MTTYPQKIDIFSVRDTMAQEAYFYFEKLTCIKLLRDPDNPDLYRTQGGDDVLDAFRHAYVSGAMTQVYGETIASITGGAHEVRGSLPPPFGNNQPKEEREMDEHNNAIGRLLGKKTTTRDGLATQVFEAILNGTLLVVNGTETKFTSSKDIEDFKNKPDYGPDPKCEEEDGEGGGATGPANDGNVGAGLGANRDPLVLDLDGDGIELGTLADSQAYFDLNGDGFATRTSWLKGDDGFLALDRNQDGKINDITELFGSPERTGYEELSELDSNADGVIDKADERFAELLVWQDVNEDGISQADELKPLTEAGIVSISLTHESVTDQQGDGQLARRGSFTWKDGTQGTAGETPGIAADVLFAQHPTFTKYTGTVTIDPTVTTVANIKGYGQIPDLHIAMSLDSHFKTYALNLLSTPTIQSLLEHFPTLLAKWSKADTLGITDIDPTPTLSVNADTNKVHFNRAGETFSLNELGIIKQYTGMDVLSLGDGQWRESGQMVTTGGW